MDKLWLLSQIDLFRELAPVELQHIADLTQMEAAPKGTLVLDPSAAEPVFYLLKSGRVRLFRVTEDGKEITLAILSAGSVFGEAEALAMTDPEIYAETMDDSVLCVMRRRDFENLIRQHPEVAMRMINILAARLREAEALAEKLAYSDLQSRLLFSLGRLAKRFPGPTDAAGFITLDVSLSHEDLAAMVGSTRETVTVTLSRLARLGLVRTGRRRLAVHRRVLEDQDAGRPVSGRVVPLPREAAGGDRRPPAARS